MSKQTGRAALSVAMLLGVYVLGLLVVLAAVALVVGVFALVIALKPGASSRPAVSSGVAHAIVPLVLVAIAVVVALGRATFARLRHDVRGLPLTADEEPELWREVRRLAAAVGTKPPDDIRVVPDVNAFVVEDSRFLGLRGGRRFLYLGYGLVCALTRAQLLAVVAHELGHYGGGHTRLGAVVWRGQRALGELDQRLGGGVGAVFGWYARRYDAVSSGVSRQQEIDADRTSARVAGTGPTVAALHETRVAVLGWQQFLDDYVAPGAAAGVRPARPYAGLRAFLGDAARRTALRDRAALLAEPEIARYDSHPPADERVRLIGAAGLPEGSDDGTAATSLLADRERTEDRLGSYLYPVGDARPVAWRELVGLGVPHDRRAHARAVLDSSTPEGGPRATLGSMLDAVEAHGPGHFTPYVDGLQAVCEAALLEAGAEVTLRWSPGPPLVDAAGHELDAGPRCRAAVEGADTRDLRAWLTGHGADLAFTTERGRTPEEQRQEAVARVRGGQLQVLSAVAPMQVSFWTWRILLVCSTGLVIKRPDGRERRTAAWHSNGFPGAYVLRITLARPVDEVVRDPRALLLPWADVASVAREPRKGRTPTLVVTTVDGTEHRLSFHGKATTEGEDLGQVLRFLLGDRYAGG